MPKRAPYTPAVGARICALVAEGKGLAAIEALPGMPTRKVMRGWLEVHPEFEQQYERARRWRADALVDEALALTDSVLNSSDNAAVTAARNAADLRKWLASKLLPQRFGDRIEVASDPEAPLVPPTEIDTQRLALALVNVIQASQPPTPLPPVTIDAVPVEPTALPVPPALEPPPTAAAIPILSAHSTDAVVVRLQQRDRARELPSNYYRGRT